MRARLPGHETKYSPDQPRDEHGRFSSDGGGSSDAGTGKVPGVAEAATSADWGRADAPGEESGSFGRWGHNDPAALEQKPAASAAAVKALDAAGYHGAAIANMAESWSYGAGIESLRQTAAGNLDYVEGEYREPYITGAKEMAELVATNPIDAELWRGVSVEGSDLFGEGNSGLRGWEAIKPGMTFDGIPSSWSRDRGVADVFAHGSSFPGGEAVLHLDPGAHGLDIAPFAADEYAWQKEVVVGEPKFMVTSISPGHGEAGDLDYTSPVINVAPVPATKAMPRATEVLLGETFTQASIRKGHPPAER
jgi:hypothetical protein